MALSPLFREVGFTELAGWQDDDHLAAFAAFRRSAFRAAVKPYRTAGLGVEAAAFVESFEEARRAPPADSQSARRFFERHFAPALIGDEGPVAPGFVTGFYEPEVDASCVRTEEFAYPLLSRPDDLVEIQDSDRPTPMQAHLAFGRQTSCGLVEYFDRREIEQGALSGRGLEIAWLADRVDAFFIHVQGAARLRMRDGTVKRITYAAKSGHPFCGPGRVLAGLGELPADSVTMQSVRAWFRSNPARVDEILHQNRSYIFFREAAVDDPALGPVAAAKVPLTAGRSLAVDRQLHTFATPFHVEAPTLLAFGGVPFRRLMIAQDTGSAITGPARGDLFAGSGDAAGEVAGVIRHAARFHALLPKSLLAGRHAG